VAHGMKMNSSLQWLSLQSNKIGPAGAATLASALKGHAALKMLNLGNNDIADQGASAVAMSLKSHLLPTLHELGLSGNGIGDAGACALADALKVNTSLRKLGLSKAEIGTAGSLALADALRVNSALRKLNLSYNSISLLGASSVAAALRVNSSLEELDLGSNSIGVAGSLAVAAALKTNSILQKLAGVMLFSVEVLELLKLPLELQGKPNEMVIEHLDRTRLPLLGCCCQGDRLEEVRALLDKGEAVDASTRFGTTALWMASEGGHQDVVKELLRRGARPTARARRGRENHSAMDIASDKRHAEVVRLLGVASVWQSDVGVVQVASELTSSPSGLTEALRREMVATRRLRDLLRPLVDPRARGRRKELFAKSLQLRLPWHLRVQVLEFVVVAPIRRGWGREEFE